MDAFRLRDRVVKDYQDYIRSFLNILDPQIRAFVDEELASGKLWPDPLLQLSPAYQMAESVDELVSRGLLHPLCSKLFRFGDASARLYRHQRDAIDVALARHNYVLTTGTGSGKSLTYIIPIFDYILRNKPERGQVRAIIVYPMNALINSQEQALQRFAANLDGAPCPVRFARYTGQESDAEKREIQQNPPHILLTNYVMLELMLTRPEERPLVEATSTDLQFLVLDELHTYRGRQGADVALLVRRLRERCGNPSLQCIGTSATMVSGETRAERSEAVAAVASKLFGAAVQPEHVIDESLRWALKEAATPAPEVLRESYHRGATAGDWRDLASNPVAGWIEANFGLREDETGRLRRREPITLMQGARKLEELTGLDARTKWAPYLATLITSASRLQSREDNSPFAFKLHQFFSQGGSVYATAERSGERYLTLEGQHYAPGRESERLLYPLAFCRECGQEYYLCTWKEHEQAVVPRPPFAYGSEDNDDFSDGYFVIDVEGFWPDDHLDLLPENWLKHLRRGTEVKKEFAPFRPRKLFLRPDGSTSEREELGALRSWFIPTPFLTCLRCGEVYSRRQRSDFGKLYRLSSEGRSTATTLLTLSTVSQMQKDPSLRPEARKLLSFTDNRQDASLQAGHFNDFVEVSLLRAALLEALQRNPSGLDHTNVAAETVAALDLDEAVYAREVSLSQFAPLATRNRAALKELIEYRLYEDLRRGWRVNQPNLEQCGLLIIEYSGLAEVCAHEEIWQDIPLLADMQPELRQEIIRTLLDYMRRELAISASCLRRDRQDALVRTVTQALREPWAFGENEYLYTSTLFVEPGTSTGHRGERSLSANTSLGRYLRARRTWPSLTEDLSQEAYGEFMERLLHLLRGLGYLVGVPSEHGEGVQIRSDVLLWRLGDGMALPRDPVRTQRMNLPWEHRPEPNHFFAGFYRTTAASVRGIEGREHTGQVNQKKREEREEKFREGKLQTLFCSPTMELGIDIADLNVVHLRNVPPTPANYAQRSGRAGRSGQPAVVVTYCTVGSGHDQYFFRRPERMVSGVVAPPRMDLANEELVRAHVQAIWLATTGLSLGRSMNQVVDTSDAENNYPLHAHVQAAIELSPSRQQECMDACRRVLSARTEELVKADWYDDSWLEAVIGNAATAFDRACDRWRELYDAAERQLQEARSDIDRGYHTRSSGEERRDALRRESEALRQKDLLINSGHYGDSDFYPYRYFASEGFLPGYNFPRLPVRAFLPTSHEGGEFLARPRFLALTEFGPRNIIYHEGRKYRVTRTVLPSGNAQSRMITAKMCHECGYFHEGFAASVDICEHCGTRLNAGNSLTTSRLFEMTTVVTQRIERITSEEEERRRYGYEITSHYRYAPASTGVRRAVATVVDEAEEPLLRLEYGPAAALWRVNHRWRRSSTEGFTLDLKKGTWAKRPGDDDDNAVDAENEIMTGVRVMVRDTRNILLVQPARSHDEEVLASLQYALQRGIETLFQVEEQELQSERIGNGTLRRILFWEASEGGAGVLTRLVEDPEAIAAVAREALELCHFDPTTGIERSGAAADCSRACYSCLLSYSNQPDHALLNRLSVRDILLQLSGAETRQETPVRDARRHFEMLHAANPDPLARELLAHLYATGRALPDLALPQVPDAGARPDFYYNESYACVFCDHVPPDAGAERARADLADRGYRIVVIHREENVEAQVERWPDIFGEGGATA